MVTRRRNGMEVHGVRDHLSLAAKTLSTALPMLHGKEVRALHPFLRLRPYYDACLTRIMIRIMAPKVWIAEIMWKCALEESCASLRRIRAVHCEHLLRSVYSEGGVHSEVGAW